MGTLEIIIVFSALMALVALVAIGIDWVGKPLKHRRFIPRMYRFDDEKLPTDAYGHTDFSIPGPVAVPAPLPQHQPAPVVVARMPQETAAPAAAVAGGATSAFTDSLAADTSGSTQAVPASAAMAQAGVAPSLPAAGWQPGMALDLTEGDRKPNLATKALRFWRATAKGLGDSHFDADDLARMHDGKAPRRKNPRTGRYENMQLTGLRQASQPDQVSMRWPDESTDPWNAT